MPRFAPKAIFALFTLGRAERKRLRLGLDDYDRLDLRDNRAGRALCLWKVDIAMVALTCRTFGPPGSGQ
jgi:hypothetical protein